jgi:hypothetical protein
MFPRRSALGAGVVAWRGAGGFLLEFGLRGESAGVGVWRLGLLGRRASVFCFGIAVYALVVMAWCVYVESCGGEGAGEGVC